MTDPAPEQAEPVPVTLAYPPQTSADQLAGGDTLDPATGVWSPAREAVVLSDPGAATRDPGDQHECQLGDGSSWSDTTFLLIPAQVQAGSLMGA